MRAPCCRCCGSTGRSRQARRIPRPRWRSGLPSSCIQGAIGKHTGRPGSGTRSSSPAVKDSYGWRSPHTRTDCPGHIDWRPGDSTVPDPGGNGRPRAAARPAVPPQGVPGLAHAAMRPRHRGLRRPHRVASQDQHPGARANRPAQTVRLEPGCRHDLRGGNRPDATNARRTGRPAALADHRVEDSPRGRHRILRDATKIVCAQRTARWHQRPHE
jgi:hypothetical protein